MAGPSTDVELVLEEVRDLHPSFDRFRANPGVALRALRRVFLKLAQNVMQERPEAFIPSTVAATIATAHFSTGYTFSAASPLAVLAVDALRLGTTDGWDPIERVGFDGRGTVRALAVQIRRGVLYPVQPELEWVGYSQWRVSFVPHPSALTLRDTSAAITALPLDSVRNALVYGTALELAYTLKGQPDAPDPVDFETRAAGAWSDTMTALTTDQRSEVFRKADVMPW